MKKQSSLFDFLSRTPPKRKADENENANESPKKVLKVEKKVLEIEEIEDVSSDLFVTLFSSNFSFFR